jgi:hypothetical protein
LPAEIHIPQPEFNHPAELAMLARLRDHGPELIEQYLAKNTRDGIVFIARDAAKRLFPEYNADRTVNNRYSDRAASVLADAARRLVLSSRPHPPRDQVILMTGSPASGKTSGGYAITMRRIEIIHETIFSSVAKARTFVDAALQARRSPTISLVYTNDPAINVRRMIERARRIQRTVPLAYMAETYVAVPQIVADLKSEFGLSLTIQLTDNSFAPTEAVHHTDIAACLAVTGRYTKDGCLRAMHHELDRINQESAIPPEILLEAKRR